MMKAFSRWRSHLSNFVLSFLLITTIAIAIVIVNRSSASAQSVTRINADIIRLRTRIDRLESQLRRTNKLSNNSLPLKDRVTPNPSLIHPPVIDGRAIGPSDPLFERLSTLLIELKEDVNKINERLTAIEAKVISKGVENEEQAIKSRY